MCLLGIKTLLLESIASHCTVITLTAHHFTHRTCLCLSFAIMHFLTWAEMSVLFPNWTLTSLMSLLLQAYT